MVNSEILILISNSKYQEAVFDWDKPLNVKVKGYIFNVHHFNQITIAMKSYYCVAGDVNPSVLHWSLERLRRVRMRPLQCSLRSSATRLSDSSSYSRQRRSHLRQLGTAGRPGVDSLSPLSSGILWTLSAQVSAPWTICIGEAIGCGGRKVRWSAISGECERNTEKGNKHNARSERLHGWSRFVYHGITTKRNFHYYNYLYLQSRS